MSFGDRRRQQTALHTVATPPAPLLLLPASQSLTFSADDVQLPGMLMPMPQTAPDAQLAVGNTFFVRVNNAFYMFDLCSWFVSHTL